MKKNSFKTRYELWYGYKPNVSSLKVFGSKCYILKESRKGKFDTQGDGEIILGYSCKSKACRCLNLSTHKVIESAHIKIDEFVEKTEKKSKKEPEDYRRFIFINTFPNTSINRRIVSTKPSTSTKLQEVQTESQGPEPV